jgi:tetratricopeptide (TPR) repeat protein
MFLFFKQQHKSAERYYNDALDLYQAGEYEKALQELSRGESAPGNLTEIHYTKGLCYQQLDKPEEAKLAFQQALSINPEDVDALYSLARIHYNEDDPDVALAYAELAESISSPNGDEQVSYLLGLIYEQQGRVEDAIRSYEFSLSINPEQVLVGIFLSKLYVKSQDYAKAIELLRAMAEHDPNNLEVFYELSLCLAKVGEWEETIKYCKRVIEIDPKYTKGYNQLGLAMYCTNRLEEAVDNYERALVIDPTYATAINNLAYTYEKMQKYEKAIEKFQMYLPYTEERPDEKTELEEHIELLKRKMLDN